MIVIDTKNLLARKRVNSNEKSSVEDHWLLSSHICSFDDFPSHKFKRLIKEP